MYFKYNKYFKYITKYLQYKKKKHFIETTNVKLNTHMKTTFQNTSILTVFHKSIVNMSAVTLYLC